MALREAPQTQLKVAAASEPKKVAAAICGRMQDMGLSLTVLASGPTSVNQAVKAIAIARKHIRASGSELVMSTTFPVASRSGSVVFELTTSDVAVEAPGQEEGTDLVVKPASDAAKVAGAISNRTRLGEVIRLVARGKESVMIAVESLDAAVNYLKNEQSLRVAPRFIEKPSPDGEEMLTMMCFDVLGSGDPDVGAPEQPLTELKVAATSEAKKVAKAICGRMEEMKGVPITVLASGASSVNQAVKAIAIARKHMLDNGTELVMSTTFPVASRSSSVVMTLSTIEFGCVESTSDESTQLIVKPSSKAAKVAGAVAARSRQGDVVQLVAKGKESMMVAVEALVAAVRFLDQNALTLLVAPRFIEQDQEGGEPGGKTSLICFDILAQQMQ